MSAEVIKVATNDDWLQLIDRNLTTVVDPMVLRAGELFLCGRKGSIGAQLRNRVTDERIAWGFLSQNIMAIGFFFDAIILNERIPLFNYDHTFDNKLNLEERSFAALNEVDGRMVEPVNVAYNVYAPLKQQALKQLTDKLAAKEHWPKPEVTASILSELSDVEYSWHISLEDLSKGLTPDEQRIAGFILGGMIFGAYSQLMQSEHWLQPKRARLFAEATMLERPEGRLEEEALFEWLARRHGLPMLSARQPTFFHYILSKAESLAEIPVVVAKLRASSAVKDYRAWRIQALHEWKTNRGVSPKTDKTIELLKKAMARDGVNLETAGDAGVALVAAIAEPTPQAMAEGAQKTLPLLGWVLDMLPGRRHVKLLASAAHAKGQYEHIERRVRTLWSSQP